MGNSQYMVALCELMFEDIPMPGPQHFEKKKSGVNPVPYIIGGALGKVAGLGVGVPSFLKAMQHHEVHKTLKDAALKQTLAARPDLAAAEKIKELNQYIDKEYPNVQKHWGQVVKHGLIGKGLALGGLAGGAYLTHLVLNRNKKPGGKR